MALKISIVVGNPKPKSRTLKVAVTFAEKLAGSAEVEVIDLADYRDDILVWPSQKMDALNASVAASDICIFASPTYKATYTGLLKLFLDRYPSNGLAGLIAIPLLTGADQSHAMGPSVNLAPLLTELGAIVPGRGLYFVISQMDMLDELMGQAAAQYRENFRRVGLVSTALLDAGGRS